MAQRPYGGRGTGRLRPHGPRQDHGQGRRSHRPGGRTGRRADRVSGGLRLGTPIWIDSVPIWKATRSGTPASSTKRWSSPAPRRHRAAAAREVGAYVVIGAMSGNRTRDDDLQHAPVLRTRRPPTLNKHRKLMPTGSERTVWGMGDGRCSRWSRPTWAGWWLDLLGELHAPGAVPPVCAGVEVWVAPTLARGDGWVATMRHIAREGGSGSSGSTNRVDQIPADFDRDRVWRALEGDEAEWVEPGNSVICNPNGEIVAGPLRHEENIRGGDRPRRGVGAAALFDAVGHYHRPDVFQLSVDTRARQAVTILGAEPARAQV